METPDPPNDTPGALKQVVLTPHDIPWSLRVKHKSSLRSAVKICQWQGHRHHHPCRQGSRYRRGERVTKNHMAAMEKRETGCLGVGSMCWVSCYHVIFWGCKCKFNRWCRGINMGVSEFPGTQQLTTVFPTKSDQHLGWRLGGTTI